MPDPLTVRVVVAESSCQNRSNTCLILDLSMPTPRLLTEITMSLSPSADSSTEIQSGEDVIHGKPNPEIYLKAMERMEVSARQTLIFEDSEVGFEAAEASGAQCIKINHAFYGD